MATNIYSGAWISQVFDKHNKAYGAYQLRLHADEYTITSLMIAVAMAAALFLSPAIINLLRSDTASDNYISEHTLSTVELQVVTPPALQVPRQTLSPRILNEMIQPVILNNNNDDDDDKGDDRLNDEKNNALPITAGTGLPHDSSFVSAGNNPIADADTEVYRGGVEINPEFPGGEEAMMQFLTSNLKYPGRWINAGVSGTVYLSFVVNSKGEVTSAEVLRGIYESRDFENEALRVVAMMPKWKPGRQNGRSVSVYFTLPVRFSLR